MNRVVDPELAKMFVMAIFWASLTLTGWSESYYKTAELLHLELIHKDGVAYLEVTVREGFYRQSLHDSAKSEVGGWPNTTESRKELEAVIFRITRDEVTRFPFPSNVSMTPIGRDMFIEMPNAASTRHTSEAHDVYALEKEKARLLDREQADAVLSSRQQLFERHYNTEGWKYIDTGKMRRLAESGKGVELDLGGNSVRLDLRVRPQGSGTRILEVNIKLPDGDSIDHEFTYRIPAKSIDMKEWESWREE